MLRVYYNFLEGEYYLITLKCKNNINGCRLNVRDSSSTVTHTVIIPVNEEIQEISLGFTATTEVMFYVWSYNSDEFVFVDDISLTIQ